ncbi:hypothetical protein [Streptomyces acidicola]|uniref:hypothetical protein n=1 Tax=Streptomyces acidicola TaxID=2596892 RepID=UPI003447B86B
MPNSVGTYGLTTADQRRCAALPSLAAYQLQECPTARAALDTTLAIVVQESDSEERLHPVAQIVTEEAPSWPSF